MIRFVAPPDREENRMRQQTLAEATFERYRKPTRRELFLDEMDHVIPWGELARVIEPFYPKPDGAGRPPVGVERMLRIHFLQHWFDLSDPAVEEALYDSRAMRRFVGIDLGQEPVPDETTICKFRHLLEAHNLGERLFALIREYLAEQGLKVSRGTIVDATIINAPSSTKNRRKQRDPEMHQTKKGNQWYFGMKAHLGVDSRTKLIHSVAATAANVHDSQVLPDLLHGQETRVWGDAAYSGQRDVIQQHAPGAKNFIQTKAHRQRPLSEAERARNRTKSKVRAKVEHVFLVIKRIFGWSKVRYRGLAKNTNWLFIPCGLANLYAARRHIAMGT
jgi:IS5 family transposase